MGSAENLAAVEALLVASGVRRHVRALRPLEGQAAVEIELGPLTVRLERRDDARPAFARTASLNVSYVVGDRPPPRPPLVAALQRFTELVAVHDDGAVALTGSARRASLPMLTQGDQPWSWQLFADNAQKRIARGERHPAVILVVDQACEMDCVFCPTADRLKLHHDLPHDEQLKRLVGQLEVARGLGAEDVDIGGNDVLRYPRAVELFDAARRLGYRRIVAQSPGQALADRAAAERFAASALDTVCVPIYGMNAASHDAITRRKGSFDGLVAALDNARALGRPRVELHTIALQSRLHELDVLVAFCHERFGLDLRVSLLRPNRLGEREHLDDAPSWSELRAFAARHPERAPGELPLCLLPPALTARRAQASQQVRLNLWDLGVPQGSEDERVMFERLPSHAPVCDGCALKDRCPGMIGAYRELFGVDDLKPVPVG